jgi:hypothetical protein
VVDNWSNLFIKFFLGGGVGEMLAILQFFEGDLGELVFQQNFTSFMKSEN